MTIPVESLIFNALKSLVSNRVYRDLAPLSPTYPLITFQQVGGVATNFLDPTDPSKHNARMQVNCWSNGSRDQVKALSLQVESALRLYTALQTTVLSASVAISEPDASLFGTMQDFSVWS